MKRIHLNGHFVFGIDLSNKKPRLIIIKADEEIACRMETLKKLEEFANGDHVTIFKGRLQLRKMQEHVVVVLKGVDIGEMSTIQFKEALGVE